MWRALQPGLGHHAASGTQGEAGSTQTLWIEGVGRLVSQRKARVLLPEGGETDAEQEKRKTTVHIRRAASSHARHRRDPSHRTALGTISACCGPFPHSTVIYLQSTCSATETGLGRLWRFRNDRERPPRKGSQPSKGAGTDTMRRSHERTKQRHAASLREGALALPEAGSPGDRISLARSSVHC